MIIFVYVPFFEDYTNIVQNQHFHFLTVTWSHCLRLTKLNSIIAACIKGALWWALIGSEYLLLFLKEICAERNVWAADLFNWKGLLPCYHADPIVQSQNQNYVC